MVKSNLTTHGIRENALRHAFVNILLKSPIRHIKFSDSNVSLCFFGHRISDHVVIRREKHVAEWSRKRKEIFIDNEITTLDRKNSFRALCVHEVIEKFS